jgi:hypothetical protein
MISPVVPLQFPTITTGYTDIATDECSEKAGLNDVWFKILTAISMKITVIGDVTEAKIYTLLASFLIE